jgi:tetratricopeptide (TPR) repeat protein
VNDHGGVANCIGTMGIVYWLKDDYDQALACYQQALDIEIGRDDKQGIAVWTGNLASVYEQRGDYELALSYSQRSLQLRHELGVKLMVAIETGNIGSTYYAVGDYPKALDYHGKALRIRQELGDRAGIATVMGYVGRDFAGLGDGRIALTCFQTALEISLDLGNREAIALNLGRIGEHFAAMGDHQQALVYLNRSVALFRRLGTPYYLSKRLASSAGSLFSLGHYDTAQRLNDEALDLAVEGDQEVQFKGRLLALRLRVALGQLESAGAQEALVRLLSEFDRPALRAAIHYEIWHCDPATPLSQRHAATAAALFHDLYHETYQHVHRLRYEELTGKRLPDPPPLPAPPQIIATNPPDLNSLLSAADHQISS